MFRRFASAIALLVAVGVASSSAAAAPAAKPHVCSGTLHAPGILKGTYPHGVVVKGVCAVSKGKAHVIGSLTVTKNAGLAAAYGKHHSNLKVTGNLVVDSGGVVILGCKVNPTGSGFPCLDEPSKTHPTLTSHSSVTGSIIEHSPLAVIVHNSAIGANIKETGGGGGLSCAPPKTGVFAAVGSPVYSDYEDSSIGGNVTIKGVNSCWLGLARDQIHGDLNVRNNAMGDPDAIEIVANHVHKNLACSGNSHPAGGPPGVMPTWDSGELSMGAVYPRRSTPNTVGGQRSGQCVTASPTTLGGPPAASAF